MKITYELDIYITRVQKAYKDAIKTTTYQELSKCISETKNSVMYRWDAIYEDRINANHHRLVIQNIRKYAPEDFTESICVDMLIKYGTNGTPDKITWMLD